MRQTLLDILASRLPPSLRLHAFKALLWMQLLNRDDTLTQQVDLAGLMAYGGS